MKRKSEPRCKQWLRDNGWNTMAVLIETLERRWADEGKLTRRNWWAMLAGKPDKTPYVVDGHTLPIIAYARKRQYGNTVALTRNASVIKKVRKADKKKMDPKHPVVAAIFMLERLSFLTKAEANRAIGRFSRVELETGR